jgi:cytidylate kinase
MSAAQMVAEAVASQLGYTVITREHVLECARKYGIEDTELVDIDFMRDTPPHFWDRHVQQRRTYLTMLKACLMEFMVMGNSIYVGHLAHFMLQEVPRVFRIRIGASMAFRVRALMTELSLSESRAKDHIDKIDERRKRWADFLYGVDYDSFRNYDMVLNLDQMRIESMAAIIVKTVGLPEWAVDDKIEAQIRSACLSAVVTAHLAQDARTRGMELAVHCDAMSGRTRISGVSPIVGSETWENEIKQVVLAVEGVSSVEFMYLH